MRLFVAHTQANTQSLREERDVIVAAMEKARGELNDLYQRHNEAMAKLPSIYATRKATLESELDGLKTQKQLLQQLEADLLIRIESFNRKEEQVVEREKAVAMSEKSLTAQYENCRKLLEDVSDRMQRADEREQKVKEKEQAASVRELYLKEEEKRIGQLSTQKLAELDGKEKMLADAWRKLGDERKSIKAEQAVLAEHKGKLEKKEAQLKKQADKIHKYLTKIKK